MMRMLLGNSQALGHIQGAISSDAIFYILIVAAFTMAVEFVKLPSQAPVFQASQ